MALQRSGRDSGGNERLWRRNYNKQSKMLCKPEVLTEDTDRRRSRFSDAAQPLIHRGAQLSNHLSLPPPCSYLYLSSPTPPPRNSCSLLFLLLLLPFRQGEAGPKGRKGEVCESDSAVLDIIHSALARCRRVSPPHPRQAFRQAPPSFYRRPPEPIP